MFSRYHPRESRGPLEPLRPWGSYEPLLPSQIFLQGFIGYGASYYNSEAQTTLLVKAWFFQRSRLLDKEETVSPFQRKGASLFCIFK